MISTTLSPAISPPELREEYPYRGLGKQRDSRSWTHRVCLVTGLKTEHCYEHQYTREGDPSDAAIIDASIAEVIVALNERGYTTMFCCSGLPEDHIDPDCIDTHYPYLMFADWKQPEPRFFPSGVTRSWNSTHWTFSLNPDEARRQWAWLAEKLGVTLL